MLFNAAVLAHNEAANIERAVRSLLDDGPGPHARVVVIVNGSSDRTAGIVAAMAARDDRIALCELALGDKANAWDTYVFDHADPAADCHLFLDGDVCVKAGSLAAIRRTLAAAPDAFAVSTLPYGGRTAASWRARVLHQHGMPGNFYALPARTLRTIRERGLWLPVGMLGDDTLLLWLLRRGLEPGAAPDPTRIVPARDAGFVYRSLPINTLAGVRAIFARHRRYALRDLQVRLLGERLGRWPDRPMPRAIEEVYGDALPWTPLLSPYGRLRPFNLQKSLFLETFWRARMARRLARAPAWYD